MHARADRLSPKENETAPTPSSAQRPAPGSAWAALAFSGLAAARGAERTNYFAPGTKLMRKCAACGAAPSGAPSGCASCDQEELKRKAEGATAPGGIPPSVDRVLRSAGEPLDAAAREPMEGALGHDLSFVRVHRGIEAAQSAREVSAEAYTVGNHIVFSEGRYSPHSAAGRELVAHELVHVVQQGHRSSGVQGKPAISKPGDAGEREADQIARAVIAVSPARRATNAPAAGGAPAVSNAFARPAGAPSLAVAHAFAAPHVARQAKAQEFPGFSQGDYSTCGAASLVSALLIWDRERNNPDSPNTLLVAACNTVLVYLDDHKSKLVKGWDGISVKGTTGQDIYDDLFSSVRDVRDSAMAAKAQITQGQYQDVGFALYMLFKNNSSAGLDRYQIGKIQDMLGIGATKSESGRSFDELMDKLTGLQPGQTAQVSWYARGKTNASGMANFTKHVFLVGRFQRGPWFVSDQGSKPPTEIEAPDLLSLKTAIRTDTQARDQGIHTGGLPAQSVGDMQLVEINPDTGVMILGDRAGVARQARDVIMKPGDFIAEVDASVWHSGDRIMAWDFVARTTSLVDAKVEMNGAGTGSGGVIVENPVGLFHVFKTSLVSEKNVLETKIDESDSKDGKVAPPKRFYHAWLQLRTASKTGAFFQVY